MTRIEIVSGKYQARDGIIYRPGEIANVPEDEAIGAIQARVAVGIDKISTEPIIENVVQVEFKKEKEPEPEAEESPIYQARRRKPKTFLE